VQGQTIEGSSHAARHPAHAYPDEPPGAGREHWKAPAGTSVAAGVAFSVFLMAVAFGVQSRIDGLMSRPALLSYYQPAEIQLVSSILLWLTIVVTGAMLLQTAITTFTQGVSLMRARRDEVAIRRQCGVLRGTLVLEFARAMLGPCLIGGLVGEVLGLVAALLLHHWTVVPVHFTPVSTLSAFPVTVVLALAATLIPAWRLANASPALLRKE
jgi:hypothetical protein